MSDDTSMVLACMDSLSNRIDYDDLLRKFCNWFENTKYTPADEVFDIGNATRKSLLNYLINDIPALECGQKSEWDNGNGSLMRIMPAVLYLHYSELSSVSVHEKINYIHNISALTHGHIRSQTACGIYAFVMRGLLNDTSKQAVLNGIAKAHNFYAQTAESDSYCRIFNGDIVHIDDNGICTDGYVVNCLEAALHCVLTTNSYVECVLKAVNLGDDTDTTAAVAGSLAGVLYGYDNIPEN